MNESQKISDDLQQKIDKVLAETVFTATPDQVITYKKNGEAHLLIPLPVLNSKNKKYPPRAYAILPLSQPPVAENDSKSIYYTDTTINFIPKNDGKSISIIEETVYYSIEITCPDKQKATKETQNAENNQTAQPPAIRYINDEGTKLLLRLRKETTLKELYKTGALDKLSSYQIYQLLLNILKQREAISNPNAYDEIDPANILVNSNNFEIYIDLADQQSDIEKMQPIDHMNTVVSTELSEKTVAGETNISPSSTTIIIQELIKKTPNAIKNLNFNELNPETFTNQYLINDLKNYKEQINKRTFLGKIIRYLFSLAGIGSSTDSKNRAAEAVEDFLVKGKKAEQSIEKHRPALTNGTLREILEKYGFNQPQRHHKNNRTDARQGVANK